MSLQIKPMTHEELGEMIREHQDLNPERPIRPDTLEALDRYRYEGIEPGGFLVAVLSNDLMGAFARADSYNRAILYQICQHVYNNMPSGCHGSIEAVRNWLKAFQFEDESAT